MVLNNKYVCYQCQKDPDLDMLKNIVVHLDGHLVDSVVTVVVHDGVGEHEHHISLELGCRPDCAALDVLLDLTEIHPPEREKSPTNH